MSINAISISSRLEAAGLDKKVADAVASEIVDSNDERNATKADIARLEGDIKTLSLMMKLNLGLTLGLYIGLVVLFVDKMSR